MNAQKQIVCVRRLNGNLARENIRLRDELRRKERECHELADANANLVIERDAADALLERQAPRGTPQ